VVLWHDEQIVSTIQVAMVRHVCAQVVHEGVAVVAGLSCESTQGGAHGRAHATLSADVERHARSVHGKRPWCTVLEMDYRELQDATVDRVWIFPSA
jgi:hypothetical protein